MECPSCAELSRQLAQANERAEKAEAACAVMRKVLDKAEEIIAEDLPGCTNWLAQAEGVLAQNPGQALLNELQNFREFAQALLPSVQPVKPGLYDKACGEMYSQLSKLVNNELTIKTELLKRLLPAIGVLKDMLETVKLEGGVIVAEQLKQEIENVIK